MRFEKENLSSNRCYLWQEESVTESKLTPVTEPYIYTESLVQIWEDPSRHIPKSLLGDRGQVTTWWRLFVVPHSISSKSSQWSATREAKPVLKENCIHRNPLTTNTSGVPLHCRALLIVQKNASAKSSRLELFCFTQLQGIRPMALCFVWLAW